MVEITKTLQLSTLGTKPIFDVVQSDTGRVLRFRILDTSIPETAHVYIYISKPSGHESYDMGTIELAGGVTIDENNMSIIAFKLTAETLSELGMNDGQVQVIYNDELVTSFEFGINVLENLANDSRVTESDEYKAFIESISEIGRVEEKVTNKIDSAKNELKSNLKVLENRMDTFASLPDGSTAGDAELIDIRVPAAFCDTETYTTAGNAVRGQSTHLYKYLMDSTKNNDLNIAFIDNGFYNPNGNLQTNSDYKYTAKTPVGNISVIEYDGLTINALSNIVFYKDNEVYGVVKGSTGSLTYEHLTAYVPYGATHFALCYYKNTTKRFTYRNNEIIKNSMNVYDQAIVLGYINKNGNVQKEFISKYYTLSNLFDVGIATKVYYNLCLIRNMLGIAFYTEEKTFISGISTTSTTAVLTKGNVNIPTNAKYMAFSYLNNNFASSIDYNDCYVTLVVNDSNDGIKNKKWLAIGDSITYGDTNNNISYVDKLNGYITTEKHGYSGYTLLALYNIRNNLPTDADIVTVFAGTNDFNLSRPLGTIDNEETTETSLTFYGEVNQMMKWCVETFPTKPVIFVTPIWRNCTVEGVLPGMVDNRGVDLREYCNAIKECGKKHGVIVYDMMNDSGIGQYNIQSMTNDGLHPNNTGQERLKSIFKNILNKYLL